MSVASGLAVLTEGLGGRVECLTENYGHPQTAAATGGSSLPGLL